MHGVGMTFARQRRKEDQDPEEFVKLMLLQELGFVCGCKLII